LDPLMADSAHGTGRQPLVNGRLSARRAPPANVRRRAMIQSWSCGDNGTLAAMALDRASLPTLDRPHDHDNAIKLPFNERG
jgi:hypothetical protein